LPFLRFSDTLIIARQIEAHLVRVGIAPPRRFECTSHQTLMAMVAAGAGWTITTPLHFARARRFQPRVSLHRFPGKGFSRRLSVISTPDCAQSILDLVTTQVRTLVTEHAIAPFHRMSPWLRDSFTLID
jgi:DNA-binding transcriptional LysR family regulator